MGTGLRPFNTRLSCATLATSPNGSTRTLENSVPSFKPWAATEPMSLRRTHCSDVLLCQSRGGAFPEGPRPICASPQPQLVPVFWPSDAARPTSSNTFAETLALTMLCVEVSTAAALKPISPFVQEAFAQGYERDARSIASSSYGSPWHGAPHIP